MGSLDIDGRIVHQNVELTMPQGWRIRSLRAAASGEIGRGGDEVSAAQPFDRCWTAASVRSFTITVAPAR